jgi:microcystin-dependent protein
VIGQASGATDVTLTTQQIPNHNHPLNATSANATATQIASNLLPGQPTAGSPPTFYANPVSGQPTLTLYTFASGACGMTGSSLPHDNMMPSLCVSFIIALEGIFPSRN